MGYKNFRVLYLLDKFRSNMSVKKQMIISELGIDAKTFQRDIDDIRAYLLETGEGDIIYDHKNDYYKLTGKLVVGMSRQEILALCKILIESRAFQKEEFESLVEKLLTQLSPEDAGRVERLIANERVNYIPLRHGKPLIDRLWELSGFVTGQKIAQVTYCRQDGTKREYRVKPVGLMFSEFYFYLIAYMADERKDSYTVFRIDRLETVEDAGEQFSIPYIERFSEADFRKRVQFMYPGELRVVRFWYRGANVEAVLDRLPTAQVHEERDGALLISAEAYGNGIDMWLRGQGEWVDVV